MSKVQLTVEIAATPQQVWDTIMDPARFADWVTIHRSVEVKTSNPDSVGARMDQVLHMRGVSFTVHWTLAVADEPKLAKWEGQGPAMSKAAITYRLSGPAEGPTAFEYTNEFTAPGGVLGAAASRMVVGHVPEHEAQGSLARLKALLEGQ